MKINFSLLVLVLFLFACKNKKDGNNENTQSSQEGISLIDEMPKFPIDTIIDSRDKKRYEVIKIGNQTWTKGVIKYKSPKGGMFRDYLYNYEAASNACPKSFMIPSEEDWNALFHYVFDSVIVKSSPKLIASLSTSSMSFACNECKGNFKAGELPTRFDIAKTIKELAKEDFSKFFSSGAGMAIMFLYLENMGFCTAGSGFKYKGGLGKDDYSYFWTSSKAKNGNHKFIRLYSGSYCEGCGYKFSMPYNDNAGYNLKCIKTN